MRKELGIITGILGGIAALEISRYSFYTTTRKEILKRDHFTCQGLIGKHCVFETLMGEAASWGKGYMITAAHYPAVHGYENGNPEAGRALCVVDHAMEEIKHGNEWGAKRLLNMGVFHDHHAEETGEQWYPSITDLELIMESFSKK